jgi:RNA polymerase sigma-70 factor (ECF subfamily)
VRKSSIQKALVTTGKSDMDELALIHQAQRGDVESFNTLVLTYQSIAYNLAYRLVGDTESAADATQEAFISAYNSLMQYRGGSFRAWLLRIVTNASYDELRRRQRRPVVSLDDLTPNADELVSGVGDSPDSPEVAAAQNALSRVIQDCLDALPRAYRLVAVLADVQGYDYREIAEVARLSLGTVKSRLSRARERLRDCLQGAGELLPGEYRLDRRVTSESSES